MDSSNIWGSVFLGFLALLGCAMGLGNVWKLPYLVGSSGGTTFLLCYLFSTLLVGIPLLYAELSLGMRARKDVISSFQDLMPLPSLGTFIGALAFVAALGILGILSMAGGWVLKGILYFAAYDFKEPIGSLGSDKLLAAVFAAIVAGIVMRGLRSGVEAFTRRFMPVFGIAVLLLLVHACLLPGARNAMEFLFRFDVQAITPKILLSALGLSFFKLSLGVGAMLSYGASLPKNAHPGKLAIGIALMDTVVALLFGVIVFSGVFTYGFAPQAGPTLVFEILPKVFAELPAGRFLGILFYCAVLFIAITSSVSLLEVLVRSVQGRVSISRPRTCLLLFVPVWAVSALCLDSLKPNGFPFFDLIDRSTSQCILPLVGALVGFLYFKNATTSNALLKALVGIVAPVLVIFSVLVGVFL